jgi:hypothetical protein
MIIKHIDETISSNQFDLDLNGDVEVYLVEISGFKAEYDEKKKKYKSILVEWQVVGECDVPRQQLHYDDITDSSQELGNTWSAFYRNKYDFGENSPYKGSDTLFGNGTPNFGGVAKLSAYIRHSQAFINWVHSFDSECAKKIESTVAMFDEKVRYKNYSNRTFKDKWHSFKVPEKKSLWALPVLCKLSNEKYIIFGLQKKDNSDWEELEELGVDIDKSLELMDYLRIPKQLKNNREKLLGIFQMGSGLGRNAFKKEYKRVKQEAIPDSEFTRLLGIIPKNKRAEILNVWANKCSYPIKVAPNPDKSEIIYLPEGELKFSFLKKFADNINQRRSDYFEAKKNKKKNEDSESLLADKLKAIPVPKYSNATMYLVNQEGSSNKSKLVIQNIYPSVALEYFAELDAELLTNNTAAIIVDYMRMVFEPSKRDTEKKKLSYKERFSKNSINYWTKVFSSILQKQYISAYEVFYNFQRFCKAFSGKELIEDCKAKNYFYVIGKLKRLQHIVDCARQNKALDTIETELTNIENNITQTKGVFGMNRKTMPGIKDIIGESYDDLRDYQQEKISAFMQKSWTGVPNEDFKLFIRGGLVGVLLNELAWLVKSEGRSFSVTQGRHPSTLRGKDIQKVCEKGIGLLMGVDKAHTFNGKAALFIQSCLEESRKDSFNSGLIMGLVFNYKTTDKED